MIKLKLQDSNNIIVFESEDKPLIRSSSGMMFHNSNELLLISIMSCFGKSLVRYLAQNKIPVYKIDVSTTMENKVIKIFIKLDESIKNNEKDISDIVINCEISKIINLKKDVIITYEKINYVERKTKPCCGGI